MVLVRLTALVLGGVPLEYRFEVRALPGPDGLSVYFLDVTARRAAQRRAERVAEQAALLARVTSELTDTLDAEWRRSIRSALPVAVAMIDIDHFKLYNDHYGHPAGDECLRKVAAAIRSNIRDTDLAARYRQQLVEVGRAPPPF